MTASAARASTTTISSVPLSVASNGDVADEGSGMAQPVNDRGAAGAVVVGMDATSSDVHGSS
jgi:hypothetical protein